MIVFLAPLLLGASSARADDAAALKAGVFDPPRAAPDFALNGSDGSELKLSTYRGKVVLLGFGFTSCAAVCPITLGTLAQVHKKLGAQAGELQVIYITVDPERDDAARLKKYLSGFDSTFVGGTGTDSQLAAVRKDYGIAAEKVAGPDGSYTHSSFIYLIDREGRLRALMPFGHVADDYVHDIRILLASR
ncbi:MAG TPA: SCO family protein [Rudaea sp.]|nr:SCO family protein [Rudaea sp.]